MKLGFVNVSHADYADKLSAEMANRAQACLTGMGIEVVCPYPVVTGSREAVACGIALNGADLDGVVLYLGSWIECSTAMALLREIPHLPLLVWGFPMFPYEGRQESTGSYVSYTMFKGVLDRIGLRYRGVLGLPDNTETKSAILSFAKAAAAAKALRRSRVGLVGYTSMSIYTGTFDHVLLRMKVGPEVEQLDSYTLIRRAEALPEETASPYEVFLRERAKIRADVSPARLETAARFTGALMELCRERDFSAVNIKCQYEFSKEYGNVMCVPLSALADMGIVSSCEGDMLCTVSMLILNVLTGSIVSYGDAINHSGNVLKLSSCGFAPFSMGVPGSQEIRKFFPHPGFSGIQSSFVLKPGRVTACAFSDEARKLMTTL